GLQFLAWLLLILFIPVAIVGARRYRLTRTSWRGIRFSFQGKVSDFMKLWLSGYALTGLSLGLYYPYFAAKKQAFLTRHSYFGSEPFKFSGEGSRLFRPFLAIYLTAAASSALAALALYSVVAPLFVESLELAGEQGDALAAILTSTISFIVGVLVFRLLLFPYSVTEQRYFWEQTSIGSAQFSLPITTWPFLKLKLGNLLLAVCTLGLAWPWITIRNIRFITDHLTLIGTDNFDAVVQAYDAAPPLGEGLDGFLDTGFDLG
ncbi:MAG: YjgN family protein, partial [Nitrospira sp.]|nr:YjgN family protein [Nitrospira sp.]